MKKKKKKEATTAKYVICVHAYLSLYGFSLYLHICFDQYYSTLIDNLLFKLCFTFEIKIVLYYNVLFDYFYIFT
jgi:hypothetical protein